MGTADELGEGARSDIRLRGLFEAHRVDVLAYCMRRVSRWDAHDAAAEVFAVAWRRIDDVPHGDAAYLHDNEWRLLHLVSLSSSSSD